MGSASDSRESDARVWDAKTGQLVRRLEAGPNNSVRISPSGRWLVGLRSRPGRGFWELPRLARKPRLENVGDDAWFTPDEKILAALNNSEPSFVRIGDGAILGSFPAIRPWRSLSRLNGEKMFVGYSTHFYEWDLPAVRRELRAIGLDWDDAL